MIKYYYVLWRCMKSYLKKSYESKQHKKQDIINKHKMSHTIYRFNGEDWTHHHLHDIKSNEGHNNKDLKTLTKEQIERIVRSNTKL